MSEDFHAFFKLAQEEGEDLGNETSEGEIDAEALKELGFGETEVEPEQADSSFFFQPTESNVDLKNEQDEVTEYRANEKEEALLAQQRGVTILLEAHRVDWIIRSAYQSLFLYLRDSLQDSKAKQLTYRVKFVNTPWTEGTVSFDTLSRFNVYYDSFSDAIRKLEPKIENVQWSPTFQGKDLFLTFTINIK